MKFSEIREYVRWAMPQPRRVHDMEQEIDRSRWVMGRLPRLVRGALDEQYWTAQDADYMVRRANSVQLTGSGAEGGMPDDGQRLDSVSQCRHYYFYDPLFSRIINLWTDFGFGQDVQLVAEDEAAQAAWDEYWGAKRNARVIGPQRRHVLSNRLLVDGELFWTWFVDEQTGLSTVRFTYTDEIDNIVTPQGDPWIALYYARQWAPNPNSAAYETWLYQDKDATAEDLAKASEDSVSGAIMASEQVEGVTVRASQFELPTLGLRGWPLMTAGADWSRAYKTFAQDRTALTRAAAMFYRKVMIKGGSRASDVVKNRLDSALRTANTYIETNPAATAGSTMIMNERSEEEQTPYATGASDADKDGSMLIAMAGIAAGVFPHYLGRGDAFRLATATAMETPMYRMWTRYQSLWTEEWLEHFNFVLDMRERFAGERHENRAATVTLDPPREPDTAAISQALTQYYDRDVLDAQTATKLALESLKVQDVDEIMARMYPEQATVEQRRQALSAVGDVFREIMGDGAGADVKLAAEVGLDAVNEMLEGMG